MKRKLAKIAVWVSVVLCILLGSVFGWLYYSLSAPDGLSSKWISNFIVDRLNVHSADIDVDLTQVRLRLTKATSLVSLEAREMRLRYKNTDFAILHTVRMHLSPWGVLWGKSVVEDVDAEGGFVQYGGDATDSASFDTVREILHAIKGVGRLQLRNINLEYRIPTTGERYLSRSANLLFTRDKTSLTIRMFGTVEGINANNKIVRVENIALRSKIHNIYDTLIKVDVALDSVEDTLNVRYSGYIDKKNATASGKLSVNLSQLQFFTYFFPNRKHVPLPNTVNVEFHSERFSLQKGGTVTFKGIVDEKPLAGTLVFFGGNRVQASVTVKSFTSDDIDTYWIGNKYRKIKKWLYDNVKGTYAVSAQTTFSLNPVYKNSFAIKKIVLTEATVRYDTSLPVAHIEKAVGTYDGASLKITIAQGSIQTAKGAINIDASTIDIVQKNHSILAMLTTKVTTSLPAVQIFLPTKNRQVLLSKKYVKAMSGKIDGVFTVVANLTKNHVQKYEFLGKVQDLTVETPGNIKKITAPIVNVKIDKSGILARGDVVFGDGAFDGDKSAGKLTALFNECVQQVSYVGTVRQDFLHMFSANTILHVKNTVPVNIQYVKIAEGRAKIRIVADAKTSAIRIPMLKWQKIASVDSKLYITIVKNGSVYAINTNFYARGKVPLQVKGTLTIDSYGIKSISMSNVKFSHGTVNIMGRRRHKVLALTVEGQGLYSNTLRALLKSIPKKYRKQDVNIVVKLNNIFSYEGITASTVGIKILRTGGRYKKISATLDLQNSPFPSTLFYTGKTLKADSPDLGAVYGLVFGGRALRGGKISLTGGVEEKNILKGHVDIRDIDILDTQESTAFITIFSLAGTLEALQVKSLKFNRMNGDFLLKNGIFTTKNIAAVGDKVAVSMKGTVDFAKDSLDIEGMLLSRFALNAILGQPRLEQTHLGQTRGANSFVAKGADNIPMQKYVAKGQLAKYTVAVDTLTFPVKPAVFSVIRKSFTTVRGKNVRVRSVF